jgi:hypothetical protein
MKPHAQLTIVEGGREANETLFQRLLNEPHRFAQEDFEQTIDLFRSRLTSDNILELIAERIRLRDYANRLEQKALLAIIDGRDNDVERLFDVLDRRNRLSWKVI